MRTEQVFGAIGSLVMILGAFLPFITMGQFGTVDLFKGGRGDGVVIVILGVVSLVLAITNYMGGLWITGAIAIGLTTLDMIDIADKMTQAFRQISGTPLSLFVEPALGIGGPVILCAALCMLIGAYISLKASRPPVPHIRPLTDPRP